MRDLGSFIADFAMIMIICAMFEWLLLPYARSRDEVWRGNIFKRDKEAFYDAYRLGFPIRLSIALVSAITFATVRLFATDDLAPMAAFFLFLVLFTLLWLYYVWCAETNRTPWS